MDDVFFFHTDKVELKEEGEDTYAYGYISTTDLDLVNDIVTPHCMESMFSQMKSRSIKIDVEHEAFKGATMLEREIAKTTNPIARISWFGKDSNGILAKALLNKHHPRFEEVKGSLLGGFLDAFSIAYIPTDVEYQTKNGEQIRRLNDLRLLNVAFTGNPVNTKARISEVMAKSLEFASHASPKGNLKSAEGTNMAEPDKTPAAPVDPNTVEVKAAEAKKAIDALSAQVKALGEKVASLEAKASKADGEDDPKKEEDEDEKAKKKSEKKSDPVDRITALESELKALKAAPQYKAVQSNMKADLNDAETKGTAIKGPLAFL
jgi:hypothetical protein